MSGRKYWVCTRSQLFHGNKLVFLFYFYPCQDTGSILGYLLFSWLKDICNHDKTPLFLNLYLPLRRGQSWLYISPDFSIEDALFSVLMTAAEKVWLMPGDDGRIKICMHQVVCSLFFFFLSSVY